MEIDTEKLREEWLAKYQPPEKIYITHEGELCCPLCGVKANGIADYWLNILLQREKDIVGEVEKWAEDNWKRDVMHPKHLDSAEGFNLALTGLLSILSTINNKDK